MRTQMRRGASRVMFPMLIFIGSIIGLLSIVGLSYTPNVKSNALQAGSNEAVQNGGGPYQVVAPGNASGPAPADCPHLGTAHTLPPDCKTTQGGIFAFAGTPLGVAELIVGIFLALGILAGLFGAGILANIMARVGVALAAIAYINGTISDLFGAVPLPVLALVNVIIVAASIVLISESL